jgi:hypothetical protein
VGIQSGAPDWAPKLGTQNVLGFSIYNSAQGWVQCGYSRVRSTYLCRLEKMPLKSPQLKVMKSINISWIRKWVSEWFFIKNSDLFPFQRVRLCKMILYLYRRAIKIYQKVLNPSYDAAYKVQCMRTPIPNHRQPFIIMTAAVSQIAVTIKICSH